MQKVPVYPCKLLHMTEATRHAKHATNSVGVLYLGVEGTRLAQLESVAGEQVRLVVDPLQRHAHGWHDSGGILLNDRVVDAGGDHQHEWHRFLRIAAAAAQL